MRFFYTLFFRYDIYFVINPLRVAYHIDGNFYLDAMGFQAIRPVGTCDVADSSPSQKETDFVKK